MSAARTADDATEDLRNVADIHDNAIADQANLEAEDERRHQSTVTFAIVVRMVWPTAGTRSPVGATIVSSFGMSPSAANR